MPSEVQILKESKARFEGVIFNQTADLGTNKSTSCKVIDEATGEVIAQSGGGGDESDITTAEVTIVSNMITDFESFKMYAIYEAGDLGEGSPSGIMNYVAVSAGATVKIKVPLYKGVANFVNTPLGAFQIGSTVSGDITKTENGLLIEGDGTITLVSAA